MAFIRVQDWGDAITGLDWIKLSGMESPGVEVRQLARSANAQWQYAWKKDGKPTSYVSFVPHGTSKKAPVAAAMLVCAAVHERNFMALIEIADLQYWVFAAVDGMPAKRMDFVGKAPAVLNSIRDFISTLDNSDDLPVYTNLPELLDTLPFSFDVRPFSLEILAHSIQKKDFSHARFQRYSPVSRTALIALGCAASAVGGYVLFQNHIEQLQNQQAAQERKIEQAKRRQELSTSIEVAINSAPPVAYLMPAYWHVLSDLPLQIAGWKLISIDCQGYSCTLAYKSQEFSTWRGYLLAKPKHWTAPDLTADSTMVSQVITVETVESRRRSAELLKSKDSMRYEMGNLAQLISPLGMQLRLQANWENVIGVGAQSKNTINEISIPVKSEFAVTGPAILLRDFSQRLPLDAGFQSLHVKLDQKTMFELKGQIYARP